MIRLSSLLVVSCALLSTFALPSICTPSSSTTSFVVAAPSNNNALFRDSTPLTDRLSRILLHINSVLDSEDQIEEEEEQEELENEQEIQQIASEDLLEDLTEGDQIIGTINTAEGEGGKRDWRRPWTWRKKAPQVADLDAAKKANAEQYQASRKAVHSGVKRAAKGARDVLLFPAYKAHQWHGQYRQWRAEAGDRRSDEKVDRTKQSLDKATANHNNALSKRDERRLSRSSSRSSSGRSIRQESEAGDDHQHPDHPEVVVTELQHEG